MSVFDLRDRLMPRLPAPPPTPPETRTDVVTRTAPPPAFAVENRETGKVLLTMPAETAADITAEDFLLRLSGRLVEAEKANGNGAFWSQDDLEFGLPSVAYGPLNWLHEERRVVGVLTDARLVDPDVDEREAARFFSAEDRRRMAKNGQAMPDGSFPIPDKDALRSAIRLARTPAQRRHVIRRARALGATSMIPDTWRETASVELGTHIEADSVMWRWLYPRESRMVAEKSDERSLWYSMECISRKVACSGERGCGAVCDYLDSLNRTEKACQHIRERSSFRRFIDPIFQGAAIIVPPVKPGWQNADLRTARQAASYVEDHDLQVPGLDQEVAAQMVAQVIEWSRVA